jgi:ABC-type branched-subunit amino acid transport system substrate-binding protein
MLGNKKVILGVLMLVIGLVLGSCAPAESVPTAETITLGCAVPLTGDAAVYGEQTKMGVDLAVEEINAAGGMAGQLVEVEYCDSKADPKEAAMCAQKFATNPDIFAVVGNVMSSCSLASQPILMEAGILQISGSSTAPKLTQSGYTHFVRNCPLSDIEGMSMAALAINNRGAQRIAVIHSDDDYGIAVRDGVLEGIKRLGGELVAMETYAQLVDKDFTAQLTKIKAADPDALLICGAYTEGGLIMRQAKIVGLGEDVVFVGAAGLNHQDFIDLSDGGAEGSYVVLIYDFLNPDPVAVEFREKVMEKYGEPANEQTGFFYDVTYCINEAAKEGATRENLYEVIRTIEFQGVTGMNKFNEVGDVVGKSHAVNQITNGAFASPDLELDMTGIW